jgi:hypothetical protein
MNQRNLFAGRERRDAGLAKVEGAESTPDTLWRLKAEEAVSYFCRQGAEFDAEDIRATAGSPSRPNMMGALFMSLRRQGLIVPTGRIRQADRSERHASQMRTWVSDDRP